MKKIIITGNVGRDPELRADQNGNQFATFSVGVSVGTKQNPKTDWVEVTCNGKLFDVARNYVKKGSKLLIEGFPSVNAYINKDNKAIGTLRVNASNFEFLGRREDESIDNNQSNQSLSSVYDLPDTDSGVPSISSDELNSIPF